MILFFTNLGKYRKRERDAFYLDVIPTHNNHLYVYAPFNKTLNVVYQKVLN